MEIFPSSCFELSKVLPSRFLCGFQCSEESEARSEFEWKYSHFLALNSQRSYLADFCAGFSVQRNPKRGVNSSGNIPIFLL